MCEVCQATAILLAGAKARYEIDPTFHPAELILDSVARLVLQLTAPTPGIAQAEATEAFLHDLGLYLAEYLAGKAETRENIIPFPTNTTRH